VPEMVTSMAGWTAVARVLWREVETVRYLEPRRDIGWDFEKVKRLV